MSLSKTELAHLAQLSRLHFSDDDLAAFQNSFNDVVAFVDQLESANADDIDPMSHSIGTTQPLRDDQAEVVTQRDAYQQNAKSIEAGLYLVPKVID